MKLQLSTITAALIGACSSVISLGADAVTLAFEDMTLGAIYQPTGPDWFETNGVTVTAEDFTWSSGMTTAAGFTEVENGGSAGGSGKELEVNNVLLDFAIPPTDRLSLRFGEYGGNLNLEINGSFRNFGNFAELDGTVVAGVAISVINGFGHDMGRLTLSGAVDQFAIGGQELWIDDVQFTVGTLEEVLLGVVFSTGEFVQIDPATGTGTLLGTSAATHGLSHVGPRLLGMHGSDELLRLDPDTGASIAVVSPGFGNGSEGAMAFRSDGTAFAIRGDTGDPVELWRLREAPASAVLIDADLGIRFDGLAFNSTNQLHGLAQGGDLYTIHPPTGDLTYIGNVGVAVNTTTGLAFTSDDTLFAVISDSLYTLDVTTAAATLVGPTGYGSTSNGKGYGSLTAFRKRVVRDSDGDGIRDSLDNCINEINPLQVDSNSDGIGNVCDADIAGPDGAGADDCSVNFIDLGRMKEVFFTTDPDADLVGLGNTEPDGIVNFVDLGRMKQLFFRPPGPSATGCN